VMAKFNACLFTELYVNNQARKTCLPEFARSGANHSEQTVRKIFGTINAVFAFWSGEVSSRR
jgi:hypothetical protein